jgi:predicted DNA-binding protein (MmcQ/YjbR family)
MVSRMAEHPRVVDPQHPLVVRLRGICMAYPETVEIEAWGRPTFRAGKKIFVVVGSSMREPLSINFKPTSEERLAYLQRPDFWSPPYWGPGGWLAVSIEGEGGVDWTELTELIDSSYREVALARQIKQLDAR